MRESIEHNEREEQLDPIFMATANTSESVQTRVVSTTRLAIWHKFSQPDAAENDQCQLWYDHSNVRIQLGCLTLTYHNQVHRT